MDDRAVAPLVTLLHPAVQHAESAAACAVASAVLLCAPPRGPAKTASLAACSADSSTACPGSAETNMTSTGTAAAAAASEPTSAVLWTCAVRRARHWLVAFATAA